MVLRDDDPRWVKLARPIANALREGPKTLEELQELNAKHFLNVLAWLENRGLTCFSQGKWRLIEVGVNREETTGTALLGDGLQPPRHASEEE